MTEYSNILCQFIENKMIKEIKSHIILETIFIFLKECCSSIEVFLKTSSTDRKR